MKSHKINIIIIGFLLVLYHFTSLKTIIYISIYFCVFSVFSNFFNTVIFKIFQYFLNHKLILNFLSITKKNWIKLLFFLSLIFLSHYFLKHKSYLYVNTISIIFIILSFFIFLLEIYLLKNKKFTNYLIISTLLILSLFEVILGTKNINKSLKFTTTLSNCFQVDKYLIWKLKPNCKEVNVTEKYGKYIIGDYKVSTDKFSRRIELNNKKDTVNKKHAVFLGCSFTFGQNLRITETFPYFFSKSNKNFIDYNYGMCGYGPHQFPFLFNNYSSLINRKSILQNRGICIYTFINAHLERVYGSSNYSKYGYDTPDVYVSNKGELVLKKRSKLMWIVYKIISSSNILKEIKFDLNTPTNSDFNFRFAKIIDYTYSQYIKVFPQGKFYIGIYPEETNNNLNWIKYLNKKIQVIVVPLPKDYITNKLKYYNYPKFDNHPKAKLNKYYIDYISKRIEL